MYCSCGSKVTEKPRSYTCTSCGLIIWKEFHGLEVTKEIAEMLFKNGRTPVISDFRSIKGKRFSAAIAIKDNRMVLEFPNIEQSNANTEGKVSEQDQNTIYIRVEAGQSGKSHININGGTLRICEDINYGLVPARQAECLGCITAVHLIKSRMADVSNLKLKISLNNIDFSRYILRERVPRDVSIRKNIEYLWNLLKDFRSWEATYQRSKRSRIKGGPIADKFPKGVFPLLKVNVIEEENDLVVELPDRPDVIMQFKASIHKCKLGTKKNAFKVPNGAKKALYAWISTVSRQDIPC